MIEKHFPSEGNNLKQWKETLPKHIIRLSQNILRGIWGSIYYIEDLFQATIT